MQVQFQILQIKQRYKDDKQNQSQSTGKRQLIRQMVQHRQGKETGNQVNKQNRTLKIKADIQKTFYKYCSRRATENLLSFGLCECVNWMQVHPVRIQRCSLSMRDHGKCTQSPQCQPCCHVVCVLKKWSLGEQSYLHEQKEQDGWFAHVKSEKWL